MTRRSPHARLAASPAAVRAAVALAYVTAALIAALVGAGPARADVPSGTIGAAPAATNRLAVTLTSSVVNATEMLVHLAGTEWPVTWSPFQTTVSFSLLPAGATRTNDGAKVIEAKYRNADGESVPVTTTVFLDRRRPATVGFSEEAVRGTLAKLEFKVTDPAPSCGTANVSLLVYRYGKYRTTFKLHGVQTNRKQYKQFTCRWDKGWYTYKVKATDAAGNACKTPGVGVLFVK